jgi:UDP-N-acetylmuramate dehydrogenase
VNEPAGVERNVKLAPHTSLRVGGPADWFLMARSADDMAAGLAWARRSDVPVRVIGGGSNLLVADAGVDGLVIKAASAASEVIEDAVGAPVLVADAGVTFANIARKLAKRGYGSIEWAANVPGTVGGAAVNNAGAFGGDTASHLLGLTLVDAEGQTRRLDPVDLGYAYRTSVLKRRELGDVAVTRVELRITSSTVEQADGLVKTFQAQRTRTQPRLLSAGSVFANPDGDFSGRLIEVAGLKGRRVGSAQISEQHANFIVNPGGATATDVHQLVQLAQQAVFEASGIWLRPEIELLGRWSAEEREALRGARTASRG